jgi:hypothetical protein
MIRRRAVLPPTRFTLGDRVRLVLGVVILLLGIVILWRAIPYGVTAQVVVVVAAFVGFGVYRLWLGYTRLREWEGRK